MAQPERQTGDAPAVLDAAQTAEPGTIFWESFDTNLVISDRNDGTATLRRTAYAEHDAAIGQEITTGKHTFTVTTPNSNANMYVGVCVVDVDKRMYPAGTSAWAMYMHDGTLCSGLRYTQANEGHLASLRDRRQARPVPWAAKRHPQWPKRATAIPHNTQIHVHVDMDAGILAFAIGDGQPQIAYTDLPKEVHPYICLGEKLDNSLMIVTGSKR